VCGTLSPPANERDHINPPGLAAHHGSIGPARQGWVWSIVSAGNVQRECSETLTVRRVLALRCWHLVLEWVMCWDACQSPRPSQDGCSISNFSVS